MSNSLQRQKRYAIVCGIILLLTLVPLSIASGLKWYDEGPTLQRLLVGIITIPLLMAIVCAIVIYWGLRKPSSIPPRVREISKERRRAYITWYFSGLVSIYVIIASFVIGGFGLRTAGLAGLGLGITMLTLSFFMLWLNRAK